MADAQKLVPFILSWEGGYVNDPDDVGGATNKGITIATWRLHGCDNDGDGDIDADDLRIITNEQWMEIFKCQYWDRWKADEIENQSIANIVVDWVWASGVHGIKQVQKILGVEVDGIVGRKTLAALNSRPADPLFHQIQAARIAFVENIVRRKPTQRKFLRGWKNRILAIKFEP